MRPSSFRIVAILALSLCSCSPESSGRDDAPRGDWRDDWAVVEGFSLELDTTGYRYPTSVAFVPEPGPAPGDPLYFVSEMEGAIKVVTNDRSVHTFAEGFFQREFEEPWELPDQRAEFGLGAIALDPVHGYVFASFGYTDEDGSLRNDIIRFSTTPGIFSLKPTASFRFTEAFGNERSSRSHQIGHMIVDSDSLLVAVGDGFNANAGQDLSTVNGKILRMTLDGKPWPDNPLFAAKGGRPTARDYVWAYGLRNPFGLMQSEHGMFAAENGPSVDRLIRIDRGRNYGYDGTDWSMGVNALAVFAPAVGPVQTAWLAPDNDLFPLKYRNAFFIAFGGAFYLAVLSGVVGVLALQLLGVAYQGRFYPYHFGASLTLLALPAGWGLA